MGGLRHGASKSAAKQPASLTGGASGSRCGGQQQACSGCPDDAVSGHSSQHCAAHEQRVGAPVCRSHHGCRLLRLLAWLQPGCLKGGWRGAARPTAAQPPSDAALRCGRRPGALMSRLLPRSCPPLPDRPAPPSTQQRLSSSTMKATLLLCAALVLAAGGELQACAGLPPGLNPSLEAPPAGPHGAAGEMGVLQGTGRRRRRRLPPVASRLTGARVPWNPPPPPPPPPCSQRPEPAAGPAAAGPAAGRPAGHPAVPPV